MMVYKIFITFDHETKFIYHLSK